MIANLGHDLCVRHPSFDRQAAEGVTAWETRPKRGAISWSATAVRFSPVASKHLLGPSGYHVGVALIDLKLKQTDLSYQQLAIISTYFTTKKEHGYQIIIRKKYINETLGFKRHTPSNYTIKHILVVMCNFHGHL